MKIKLSVYRTFIRPRSPNTVPRVGVIISQIGSVALYSGLRRINRRRKLRRFRKFLWLSGGRWLRHAYQQPCLSARVSKMDRNRGHVLGEIAQRRLENCLGVIAIPPGCMLGGLVYLPGKWTRIAGYRALKRSADNALTID